MIRLMRSIRTTRYCRRTIGKSACHTGAHSFCVSERAKQPAVEAPPAVAWGSASLTPGSTPSPVTDPAFLLLCEGEDSSRSGRSPACWTESTEDHVRRSRRAKARVHLHGSYPTSTSNEWTRKGLEPSANRLRVRRRAHIQAAVITLVCAARVIEVHDKPVEGVYSRVQRKQLESELSLSALPDVTVEVRSLFPSA